MATLNDIIPGGFDAASVEPQQALQSGEPLPAGVYEFQITAADLKITKKGGTGLNVEYIVIGGQHERRKVWQFINLKNHNPQAEQIGQAQLSALCRAVNIPKLTDTDQLFGKILRISVKVRPASGEYAASNDVKGYEAVGVPMPQAAQSAMPPLPAKSAVAPWARG
jgi:hypothetical protein